jgi:dipeptidyl aminopeptidase/acylaminoacyl peptidase
LSSSKLSPLLDMAVGQPAGLAEMRPVKYRARDGLEIPAFLTLPTGRKAERLPLVIKPHGGPFGIRDHLTFDPEVQMLANRGYAVLQPNYRGSGGYGLEFLRRGEGEWGRKMQDDLDDGMDWLAGQGIIDPKRVCIAGGSYGGYAAAWGATRNPERYRCAACYAGVFDLGAQLSYDDEFLSSWSTRLFRRSMKGSTGFNLGGVSPLQQVERLQVPVLLVHGEEDSTVPVKQSQAYHGALARHAKPHEYYTIPNEVHGFTQKGSFAFYLAKLDAFLAAHNPA